MTKKRTDTAGDGNRAESRYRAPSAPSSSAVALEGERYASWDLQTAARRVSEGLPTAALSTLQERLDLTNDELAHLVLIAPRTLGRRKKEKRLPPDESERVYRAARLVEIAAETLNGLEEARSWMREPNFALGDQTPLETARTEPGAALVERVLGHIDYGIPV